MKFYLAGYVFMFDYSINRGTTHLSVVFWKYPSCHPLPTISLPTTRFSAARAQKTFDLSATIAKQLYVVPPSEYHPLVESASSDADEGACTPTPTPPIWLLGISGGASRRDGILPYATETHKKHFTTSYSTIDNNSGRCYCTMGAVQVIEMATSMLQGSVSDLAQ